jgi:hypothetical protein
MSTQRKLRIILGASKNNIPLFLVLAQAIYTAMSNAPSLFPSPPVALGVLFDQIQALIKAQQTVRTRVLGAAQARNVLRDALFTSVDALRTYVQGLCDAVSLEAAANLAASAAMKIGASTAVNKPMLAAKLLAGPVGNVALRANAKLLDPAASKRKYFNWSYSVDGGATWLSMPSTLVARTTITGLPALTTVSFRVSITTTAIPQGDWSQVIALLVH